MEKKREREIGETKEEQVDDSNLRGYKKANLEAALHISTSAVGPEGPVQAFCFQPLR